MIVEDPAYVKQLWIHAGFHWDFKHVAPNKIRKSLRIVMDMYLYVYVLIHTYYIYIYVHIVTYTYIGTYTYIQIQYIHKYAYTYVYVYIYIYIHAHIHIYIYIYIYTYMCVCQSPCTEWSPKSLRFMDVHPTNLDRFIWLNLTQPYRFIGVSFAGPWLHRILFCWTRNHSKI